MLTVAPYPAVDLLFELWKSSRLFEILTSVWKIFVLVPVHIKGERNDPSHYRPICLQSHHENIVEDTLTIEASQYFSPHLMHVRFQAGLGPEITIAKAIDFTTHGDGHIAVLCLKSAYDMRYNLMQRCRSIFPSDLCEMICLALSNMTLKTLGDPARPLHSIGSE